MPESAVLFGAGNIGRGFLAQLFRESGLEPVFIDIADPLVDAINSRRSYSLQIVGDSPQSLIIDRVRAVHGKAIQQVVAEIQAASIISTSVGASVLPHIAPTLAAGLLARYRAGRPPINILVCENLYDAALKLREAVASHLPVEEVGSVLERVGFAQAVVSRMVPQLSEADRSADLLAVRVEAYKRLPVDASALVAPIVDMVGIQPVENFTAHVARKLYSHNCAHAVLGYLGYLAGIEFGYEALADGEIRAVLDQVLDESGCALISRYGFDPEEHRKYREDLLKRFTNKSLGDDCRRLARDPIRKLAPGDRLVGAARLCEAATVVPNGIAIVIAAALRYDDPTDPGAMEMQRRVQTEGVEAFLLSCSGIHSDESLFARIACWLPEQLTARGGRVR